MHYIELGVVDQSTNHHAHPPQGCTVLSAVADHAARSRLEREAMNPDAFDLLERGLVLIPPSRTHNAYLPPGVAKCQHSCHTRRSNGTERFSTKITVSPRHADIVGCAPPLCCVG